MAAPRPLTTGIYVASLTFFTGQDEVLDLATHRRHILHMVEAGVKGIVLMGSNGEAPHISCEERKTVIHTTRAILNENGYKSMPIIAGCSDQSVKGAVQLCRDAALAGADYALVLPPSYFRPAISADVIVGFYHDVAEKAPLPIILYSFPSVVAGIELSSDVLIAASQHKNVVGTKFTCADTGKLNRVSTAMKGCKPSYVTLGGLADFILPGLVAGASGMIVGGANVAPRSCVRVCDLWARGQVSDAYEAQCILSTGDWAHTRMGLGGTKAVLQETFGYGGAPRRPLRLPDPGEAATKNMFEDIEPLMQLESELAAAAAKKSP
ncbi:4-hydroxy-2-oxoglutarate aldolase, mitochondrial [Knufia peltigerae]|uniref:4-hydroxy-2-oxoglutarate aldolase, mitochondrial n=1 Tax=Knufia peltigerae TaxID=1002370 RepID=A0AA38Y395_9EURO|nr:4-hydroxy-2-oxoglutarate aldolase, mitochondrial [Knufia peltigerae]